MKIVYLALGLWLLPGMLWAQSAEKENEFTMSMQIRPRAEYRNGAQFPRFEGDKAAAFINNRARLSMEYKRSDLSMKISAQHVGVWGQDPQIDTNGPKESIFEKPMTSAEGWVEGTCRTNPIMTVIAATQTREETAAV